MPFTSKTVPPERVSEFLAEARTRYQLALDLDDADRKLALDDAEFALAEPRETGGTTQWHQAAAQRRVKMKRPCLTENRIHTFTAQVVNDGRQSKPAIKITAMDGGTKDTAEYYQGRIRQIEYDCNADIAYDTAREQQVTCGRAFIRVTWEYEWKSFKRRIRIQRIDNQFSVLFGPAQEYDCSDAEYCFVVNTITREQHKRKYGDDTTAAHTDFASTTNPAPGWLGIGNNGEMIQEAEYWVKKREQRTLCLLSNGRVCWADEIPQNLTELGLEVEEKRQEFDYKVIQYIIDGADILKETEFPGPAIPIVPQWGREYFLDGKRRTLSLIRYAKDPQRLLNLYVSNIAEQIAMMPKTPFWVPMNAIPAGAEAAFETLNDEPRAFMLYNSVNPLNPQQPLPPPHRETNEPPIMALVAGYQQQVDAIKASMGIYDASLGNRSNETSGIGIQTRQRQADNANFHFHDNEARTRNQIGRIMVPLIREMDKGVGERSIRSEDGKSRMVTVGKKYRDKQTGKAVMYDLETGNYGVAVETGPSYNSQREEGFDKLTQMASKWPALLEVGGPTILRLSDIPGSDRLADLMEKTLPPELRSENPDAQAGGIPPEVAEKFQEIQKQAGQVIQGLTEKIKDLEAQLAHRQGADDTKRYIAELREETVRMVEAAKLGQREAQTLLLSELQGLKAAIDRQEAERQRQHEASQADLDRQSQMSLAAMPPPQPAAQQPNATE